MSLGLKSVPYPCFSYSTGLVTTHGDPECGSQDEEGESPNIIRIYLPWKRRHFLSKHFLSESRKAYGFAFMPSRRSG
jgi:hypothetical protein